MIAVAVAPSDGADPNQLMKNADLALYRSKADGGNVYRFFEEQMDARMQEYRALELALRKALANGEFSAQDQLLDLGLHEPRERVRLHQLEHCGKCGLHHRPNLS